MPEAVTLGFDAFDGATPIPNGVDPRRWGALTELDRESPIEGVNFRASWLLDHASRAGLTIRVCPIAGLADCASWFYLLRPFGVPDIAPAFANLSVPARAAIDEGRCRIIVDYSHEGYSQWMLERVYDALDRVPIPPNRVILLSGDRRIAATHEEFLRARPADPIHVRCVNYFRMQVGVEALERVSRGDFRTTEPALGPKHLFLNFNRRNRLHRILAVTMLHERGLLRHGKVSLPGQFDGRSNEDVIRDECERFGIPAYVKSYLADNYPRLAALLPLKIDAVEIRRNLAFSHPTEPYENTALSLVSESLFFECGGRQVFLSEKVFKPILNHHPFLVIGDAGTLAALREMGFQTFAPFFDESYDDELDPVTRLTLVIGELERISAQSPRERSHWQSAVREILQHNFQHLTLIPSADQFSFLAALPG